MALLLVDTTLLSNRGRCNGRSPGHMFSPLNVQLGRWAHPPQPNMLAVGSPTVGPCAWVCNSGGRDHCLNPSVPRAGLLGWVGRGSRRGDTPLGVSGRRAIPRLARGSSAGVRARRQDRPAEVPRAVDYGQAPQTPERQHGLGLPVVSRGTPEVACYTARRRGLARPRSNGHRSPNQLRQY